MGAYWISAITPNVKLGVEVVVVVKRPFLFWASLASRVDRRGDLREAFSLILLIRDDVCGDLSGTCWIECECEWNAKAADNNARYKQRARSKRDFDECNRKGMNGCCTRIRLIRLYSVVQLHALNTWVGSIVKLFFQDAHLIWRTIVICRCL
jgi:hypothetical protein